MAAGRTAAGNKIYVSSLHAPETRTLVLNGVAAFAYASPNYLIYLKSGTLLAQAFDRDGFTLIGKPTTLANNALPPFSASRTGAVTYRTNPPTPSPLVWIRTDGSVIENALPPGYYTDPVISPDGTEVAYATHESIEKPLNVSILNLASRTSRNLTVGDVNDRAPVWSPDGKEIVFLSQRPEAPGMYRKSANGIGAGELILPFPGVLWPYQWVGRNVIYFAGVSGANDVWMLSSDNPKVQTPLIQTPANEVDGAVSPDGKWLVYSSSETGRWEIYLTTFPVTGTKVPITTRGGTDPLWGRDGKKLFYVKPATAELFSVSVIPGNPPQFGAHTRIYTGPLEYPSAHSYDVDPKSDRIIVAPSFVPQGDITVLLNWASTPN
jgi:dipeptidyl aminopeptidase/acylaminoacyl peptidase